MAFTIASQIPPCVSFCDLPDELLLEIMCHFESVRASEPQSIALNNLKRERTRQSRNQRRQRTLRSLCLTSRHVRRIATPVLYASFTGTLTWKGIEHLRLFHRTISSGMDPDTHRMPLSKCIRYIENRLSNHLGNSLYANPDTDTDTEDYDTAHMAARYFYLLAEIVKLAPNLQHLCVVSLETDDMSFWRHILPRVPIVGRAIVHANDSNVSFSRLETLCLQVNSSSLMHSSDDLSFARILLTMKSAPLPKELQACGVMSSHGLSAASSGPLVPFKTLQRLEITKCQLDIEEVVDLWLACEGLQHITCEWAYLNSTAALPSDLLPGLLKHAETLRTLHLDLREVRFDIPRPPEPPLFGSLRALVNLQSLTVCERFTSDDHYTWDGRLADLLSTSLEKLVVLRHPDGLFEFGCHEDRIRNLRHLAEDCQAALPKLKYVAVYDFLEFHASDLQTLFRDAGVQFQIVLERP
ncbi:hypothetical protein J1614_005315 [Plenodomus biglobosus]|nr:hypothetical protein J1614_005315 [Plenodomus biglobosus]